MWQRANAAAQTKPIALAKPYQGIGHILSKHRCPTLVGVVLWILGFSKQWSAIVVKPIGMYIFANRPVL